jgi:histone deacetylase 1/2
MAKANIKQYYGPDYELDVRASNMENANSKDYLEKIKMQVIENLKKTAHAPSVQMTDVPRTTMLGGTDEDEAELDDLDEDENMDVRMTQRRRDKRVARDDEFEDSDDEEERPNGMRPQNGPNKRRNIMDYSTAVASDIEMDSAVATPEVRNEVDVAVTAMAAEVNADVNDVVMEEKSQTLTSTETVENGASDAVSIEQSAKPAVDNEGDVDMAESTAEPTAQVSTPVPEARSSPAATAPASAPANTEAEPVAEQPTEPAKEEIKQQEAETTGEASTETTQQPQT